MEIARLCNPHLNEHARWHLSRLLQAATTKAPLSTYTYLSHDQRADLLSRYADSNARVACRYFDKDDGQLFPPPVSDEAADTEYAGLTPGSVARVLTLALTSGESDLFSVRLLRVVEMKLREQKWLTGPISRFLHRTGII